MAGRFQRRVGAAAAMAGAALSPPIATGFSKDSRPLVTQQTISPRNCKTRELEARSVTKDMKASAGDTDRDPKWGFQVWFYFLPN